jgi:cation:H+ antiporter
VLGSNIANICLILGATALISPDPGRAFGVACGRAADVRDHRWSASLTMLDRLVNPEATIGPIDGMFLLVGLAAYVFYNIKAGKIDPEGVEHELEIEMGAPEQRAGLGSIVTPLLLVGAGLAGLVLGAKLLVDGASSIAAAIGVSEAIIGLTVVAFGTSVPELVFSARAAMKDHPEIAIGNIIGSNVFNLLSVLGVASLVRPIAIPAEAVHRDIWIVWA